MKNNKLCKCCTSKNSSIILGKKCTLQPFYNNEKCPCSYCLLKIICIQDYITCEKYKEFCMKQAQIERINIPCKGCINYKKCLDHVKEYAEEIELFYLTDTPKYSFDNIKYSGVIDEDVNKVTKMLLNNIIDVCNKIKQFFPYSILVVENIISFDLFSPFLCDYRNFTIAEDLWFERYSQINSYYIKYITEIITQRYKKADPIKMGLMRI